MVDENKWHIWYTVEVREDHIIFLRKYCITISGNHFWTPQFFWIPVLFWIPSFINFQKKLLIHYKFSRFLLSKFIIAPWLNFMLTGIPSWEWKKISGRHSSWVIKKIRKFLQAMGYLNEMGYATIELRFLNLMYEDKAWSSAQKSHPVVSALH